MGALRPSDSDIDRMKRRGMLFAAGLITGEALIGVLIAIPIVVLHRDDLFALPGSLQFGGWVGLLLLAGLAIWMFKVGTSTDRNDGSSR
jgi:hypothetical protein